MLNGQEADFVQEFEVQFLWIDKKKNYSEELSGNPGYIDGKPILMGTLRNLGNNSNPLWRIHRDPENFKANFLTIPESKYGTCMNSNDTYLTVEFGFNFLLKCRWLRHHEIEKKPLESALKDASIKITVNNTKKVIKTIQANIVNASFACRNIQKSLLNFWGYEESQKIGMFGNAKENFIEEWISILSKERKEQLLNKTVGHLFLKEGILKCSNLINMLKIGVFYARVDIESLYNQNKILGITYEFVSSNYTMIYKNFSVYHGSSLKTTVVFFDITSKKQKKIVDPPGLDIKLPYDFFYPFVKVDNSGSPLKVFNCVYYSVLLFVSKQINIF